MRIQHNIMAMNAYRNYNNNTKALSGNLEKLSSGYKINRAGDDAAGLAISEKMRAQITGLDAAQKNVKDGISLVKTAEGAMQEIQDMLNRMDYLATQSANGTYDNEVDRYNLQKEVNQLKDEINRIADSANFNGIKLLDGSQSASGASPATSNVDVAAINDAQLIVGDGKAVKGKYTLDLSQYEATVSGTSKQTATFDIKIGNVTVAKATVTLSEVGITGTGSTTINLAEAIKNNKAKISIASGSGFVASTTTKTTISMGGVSFTVGFKDGKISLTMQNDPTAEFDEDFGVTIDTTGSAATVTTPGGNGNHGNNGETLGVKIEQHARPAQTRVWAQGEIDLNELDIKDGAKLTIGDKTFTFALTKESADKADANTINLYKWGGENLSKADLAKYAAKELSAKTTDTFELSSKNTTDGKLQLTEKEQPAEENQSKVDYSKNDLQGKSGTTDGNWKGLVQFTAVPNANISGKNGLTLQIGDTSDKFNQMDVNIGDMHVTAMGDGKKTIADVDISTQKGAQDAVETIKAAINYVSGVRGDLGAIQNRLEHTGNNLSVMAENIQDAESTIRDTDVADEMMKYVKNNILVQSAQAMLAQANQVPQGVLQLLG